MHLPPPAHHSVVSSVRWLRAPYPYLDSLRKTQGETFQLRLFNMNIVVFTNPEHVREIFADGGEDLNAGQFNRTLAPILGDKSVLMVDGRAHLRKRKLLLAPLHGERMQAYGATMRDVTDDAIDALPHGTPFSFHGPMQDITLRVIVRTVFGFEGAKLEEEMVKSTARVLELGAWAPLLIPAMQFDLGRFSPYGRFRRVVAETDRLLYREIERRRRDGVRGADVLSLLLDARDDEGKPMEPAELRDELVTLLVAGHETTATGLTWAMRWLLQSPAILAELRAELDALGPDASPEAIAKAPFLDGVVREALRLVPIIPMVGRTLARDCTVGGYDLQKGSIVTCSIYLAHRRAEAFPDPQRFEPRRFIGKKLAPSEFFPFGGGLRRCVGMAFALYEMKMVLARLVMRTEMTLEENQPLGMVRRSITITPSDGLRVVLGKRRLRAVPS